MTARQTIATCIASLALICASAMPLLAQTPVTSEAPVYVGHSARLTATIPDDWTYQRREAFPQLHLYNGADGFVSSVPMQAGSLREACITMAANLSATNATEVAWNGQPACQIDGTFENREARTLVVAHPYPFTNAGFQFAFAAISTDPDHFDEIASSVSFEPDRVTPRAYVSSVIDIVEASSWFGAEIDWDAMRPIILRRLDAVGTMDFARFSVGTVLQTLYAQGDNHSIAIFPGDPHVVQVERGFGMIVGGTRIIALFRDGPAAKAGLQVGDVIRTVNGGRPVSMPGIDPGSGADGMEPWPTGSILAIERPGTSSLLEVVLSVEEFAYDLPPTGRRLDSGLGYINIPGFRLYERGTEFATTGIGMLTSIDRQHPTCGWVVDLRLNTGGFSDAMVSAIGPLVGNGTFGGSTDRNGETTWRSLEDGTITETSGFSSTLVPESGPSLLGQPNPPVAVLTSSHTASSGEATALAFVGHPTARSFGETTMGHATGNDGFLLFDGTELAIASTAMVDRNGHAYLDGIPPDDDIAIDWATYGTADDPVLNAAQEWLLQQPGCTTPLATPAPS